MDTGSVAPDDLAERRRKKADYMREYTRRNAERINAQRRARRTQPTLDRERAYRLANPDRVKEYKKRDREKRPDDYRRWRKDWAERNVDRLRERSARAYREHKDDFHAKMAALRTANPERWRKLRAASSQRRRARLAGVPQEPIDRDLLYQRDGGKCGLCGRKVAKRDLSLDHIIPIMAGGPHTYANVQLAHTNCNKRRGHRGPAQMRLTI